MVSPKQSTPTATARLPQDCDQLHARRLHYTQRITNTARCVPQGRRLMRDRRERVGPIVICAGIVTYEPDLDRLGQNLTSIADQVDRVLVFDNGSSIVQGIRNQVAAFPKAQIIESPQNIGIAGALNEISSRAHEMSATWVVTLDQDSVAPANMVAELLAVAKECPQAALVTPYIVDRNKLTPDDYLALDLPRHEKYRQAARKGAITSGALTSLRSLIDVGGFDERMFIDYVDYDLNQRLLLAGYEIVRANHTHLLHEVGRARKTWLVVPRKDISGVWKFERFYSFGHSSTRCYYKARNRVLFTKKYGRHIGISHEGVAQLPQQIALTLLFEDDRRQKLTAFARGIRDGLRMRP